MTNDTKNSSEAVTKFSERLHHSEIVLEYSLYLSKALHPNTSTGCNQISKNNITNYLDKITDDIWNDFQTFTGDKDFNFFGYKGSYDNKEDLDLSLLSTRSTFWEHALKQHAIISAFDKLRKVIGESYVLSPTERVRVSNFTLKHDNTENFDKYHHGFDFLTMTNTSESLPWLNLTVRENNTIPTISNKSNCQYAFARDNSLYCENAQNHKRRIEALNARIKKAKLSIEPLYLSPSIGSNPRPETLFSLLEFYNFTVNRHAKESSKVFGILPILNGHTPEKNFSSIQYNKYITSVNHLLASVAAKEIDKNSVTYDYDSSNTACKLNLSDKIYLRYQLEKVFAPSTINCLYQNTVTTKDKIYALNEQNTINLLASCLRLPNVFTRQYILQMAVDTISKHYDALDKDSDFFTKKMESPALIMTLSRTKYNHLNEFYKMDTWVRRYRNAMSYLTQILFPVYENYFFCALWNTVKIAHSKYTDAQIVVEMYKLLQHYLNNQENVENLFATDDIIINSLPKLDGFELNNIIHPSFILAEEAGKAGKGVDHILYKHCLIAHTLTYKDELTPDFISLPYLDKIANKPHKQIQDLYILESASFKR